MSRQARPKATGPARRSRDGRAPRRVASAREKAESPRPKIRCPVVGIGASAGGLAAFEGFFRAMPPHPGVAFVLIQHLDPTHESITAELVGKHTHMPVMQVERDTRIETDHVYVIPPNRYLGTELGTLRLTAPTEPRGLRMPIDFFLRSLAADQQERAVGIVLSGTGADGTLGIKEVKAGGGMTMAQAPETAQYDGMPRSAIATGCVDRVLPVAQMPEALLRYARHAYVSKGEPAAHPHEEPADSIVQVLALLRARTGLDFGSYKKGTLRRRIQRRMSLRHVAQTSDYLPVLRSEPDEAKALAKDLLISVTSFFRDPEAWQLVEQEVIPLIVERAKPGQTLRAWVVGCATGE